MQVANPNRAQFTKCASYAIPSTTRKKLTVSRKMAKILTVSRKSHHPIDTFQ